MKKETKILLAEIVLIVIICSYRNDFFLAFIWIILHEIAHILMATVLGCKYYNIEFHIFGAKAELTELDLLTDNKKLLTYLAGPLFNIISVIILALLKYGITSPIVDLSIDLNIGLALFNMLPAYPLDGARIYEILLTKKMVYKKARKIISISSYIVSTILVLTALFNSIFLHKLNFTLLLGGLIIIFITRKESHEAMYITMGNIVKKRDKLLKNKYIENKCISVYYKNGLVTVLGLVDRNKFNSFYVLDDEMRLLYIFHEDELIFALKNYGNITLEEYMRIRKV